MTDLLAAKREQLALLEEKARRRRHRRFFEMYPETGNLSRYAYPRHMEVFALGAIKPFRMFGGGNGSGKTWGVGSYEMTCHATGIYPEWWVGKRYNHPVEILVAGNTKENVRDIIQPKLIGRKDHYGENSMLPASVIGDVTLRSGANGAIDTATIKHVSGGLSRIMFKAYEMGRTAFEGFEVDAALLDEEPPPEIYSEVCQRFRTREPCLLLTFTPLKGISQVVSMFLPHFAQDYTEEEYEASGRAYVLCSQDEVPHLSDEEKIRLRSNVLSHEREARRHGVPSIGAGKIYPVEESKFVIPPVALPKSWPRLYGFDVGWNNTAAIWGAWDRENDCIFIYSEHFLKQEMPPIHAAAIKARGVSVAGMIDPAARGRGQDGGLALMKRYRDLGLRLVVADNSVDDGLLEVQTRLETDRLKVFATCQNWIREFRLYRRDDNGKIVKKDDHCLHPDTFVETVAGPVRIADLPESGLVVSTEGRLLPYRSARRVAVDQPMVCVQFSDGRKVVCTPDHKFLTAVGWMRADTLHGAKCYDAVSHRIHEGQQCASQLSPTRFKSFRAFATTTAASISSATEYVCTALYGRRLIPTSQFQPGITSTMRTETRPTISPKISLFFRMPSIPDIICLASISRSLSKRCLPRLSGTGLKLVLSGTSSITKSSSTFFTARWNSLASSAERNAVLAPQDGTVSVATTASPHGVARLGWMTSKGRVLFAKLSLWLTGTQSQRRAAAFAAGRTLRCVAVTPSSNSDVYCISVPGEHAFAVEGGLLVSNCMDSTRYLCMGMAKHGTIARPENRMPKFEEITFGL